MPKEIKINFSYTDHEFLLTFYEKGQIVKWVTVHDSADISKVVSQFYFPK